MQLPVSLCNSLGLRYRKKLIDAANASRTLPAPKKSAITAMATTSGHGSRCIGGDTMAQPFSTLMQCESREAPNLGNCGSTCFRAATK